ncbi:MAG: hypothetical protein ABWY93_09390 [Mycobacterium sp.]
MTDFSGKVRWGYVLAGAVIGGLWISQSGTPLWEHAVRLLGLMAIVMLVRAVVARVRKSAPKHPIARFIAVKVALVAAGVLAAVLIGGRLDNEDLWIGLGLFAVVAVFGPGLHPWLTRSGNEHEVAGAIA